MKLNKAAMIKMIDDIEVAVTAEHNAYNAALEKHRAAELEKWKADDFPKWVALRDLLTTKVKGKKPVTAHELRELGFHDRYSGVNVMPLLYSPHAMGTFRLDGKDWRAPNTMDSNLKELRSALSLIKEDEISYSALASLGFRNMTWFFKKAALAAQS